MSKFEPEAEHANPLEVYRGALNRIDGEIIALLGERYAVCRDVAAYKKANGIPMMQPQRVEEVKERCARLASERGVNRDFARQLYTLIIDEACRMEDDIIDAPT